MLKRVLALSALAGATLLSVPAIASPITGILSITGSDAYSNILDTISFVPGSSAVGGVSMGTLAGFTAGNPITMTNFNFGGTFVAGTQVFSTTEAGVTTALTLQSLTSMVSASNGLVVNGLGTLTETGFTATPTAFTLTSQDGGTDSNVVTFSASVIPAAAGVTPEPSGIALLGTGLLCAAGLVRRRLMAV